MKAECCETTGEVRFLEQMLIVDAVFEAIAAFGADEFASSLVERQEEKAS